MANGFDNTALVKMRQFLVDNAASDFARLPKSRDDMGRATVMFQGPENVLYDIFINPNTRPIVESSGHIYNATVITRWLAYYELAPISSTRS